MENEKFWFRETSEFIERKLSETTVVIITSDADEELNSKDKNTV